MRKRATDVSITRIALNPIQFVDMRLSPSPSTKPSPHHKYPLHTLPPSSILSPQPSPFPHLLPSPSRTTNPYISPLLNSPAICLLFSILFSFAFLSASNSGILRALSVAPFGTRTSLGEGSATGRGVGAARRRRMGVVRIRRRVVGRVVRMVD